MFGEGEKVELTQLNINPVSSPMVRCLECPENSSLMYVLTKAHLEKVHGMTKAEYLKKHPEQSGPGFWGTVARDRLSRQQHVRDGGKGEKV